jgi:hypothetical protein
VINDFGNHVGPGTDLVQEAFCDPAETLIDCGVQAGTLSNGNEVDLSGSFYHVAGLRRLERSGGGGPGCHVQITIDNNTGNQDVLLGAQAFCAAP